MVIPRRLLMTPEEKRKDRNKFIRACIYFLLAWGLFLGLLYISGGWHGQA